ncbi:MAG: M24 family metallopeptidase [Caldilineaceae bacterium]|nr:M24 family metallopeptidase [Caldilineaceae bacterium]
MSNHGIELGEIELPAYGEAAVQPTLSAQEYEARMEALRVCAESDQIDVVIVYADREHSANLAFLTGFDPRFEEALLIVANGRRPILLVGNEGWDYTQISPLDLDVQLYQPFSLLGQDRTRSRGLSEILRSSGVGKGTRVGVVDWKYFGAAAGPGGGADGDADLWINAPAYLIDSLRQLSGAPVVNVTRWLMDAQDGLRAVNTVDQLACFEFAATCISNAMRRALRALQPGVSEIEVMRAAQHPGLPNSMHPIIISGPRTGLALASPSMRVMQLGDPVSCAMGVWGALNARAGFLVHDASELPAAIQDYLDRLVKPYFAAIAEWYSTVGIGVTGAEMYALIQRHLGDSFFGVGLNPGHLIHLDEWVHSPIFAGSSQVLRAGMALQVDVIPATHSPYFTTNIEDGIGLADAAMRQTFAARWPAAWARIQARRRFMEDVLGIRLKPEVLPFSNLSAHLTPYLLSPHLALRKSE